MKTPIAIAVLLVGCSPVVIPPTAVTTAPKCDLSASWAPRDEMGKQLFKTAWTAKTLNIELRAIAWQESYFNTRLDHEKSITGEYGTAFGPLGLKPSTAHIEYKASKRLQTKYPGLLNKESFLNALFANPTLYNELANAHWIRLKNATGGALRAAYAWRWGIGALKDKDPQEVMADEYVGKYATREGLSLEGDIL